MKKSSSLAPGVKLLAAALLLTCSAGWLRAAEVQLIPLGTTNRIVSPMGSTNWRYRLGTSEASSPIRAWRTNEFIEDGTWITAGLPLGYATAANDPNNYEPNLVTTVPAATTNVFVRKTFVIANRLAYSAVTVSGFADDGVVTWINGREFTPRFQCCTGGTDPNVPTFDALSPTSGDSAAFSYTLTNDASGPLVDGTNVLCIQLFNANTTSSDLVLDASLTATLAQVDLLAPGHSIVGVAATAGSSVSAISVVGTAGGANNYPAGESPPNVIDANAGTKYLNFAKINCGFIVTIPSSIATVSEFKFTTANDSPERDPATVTLEGSTATDATTAAGGATWVTLYSGVSGLAADPGRSAAGATVSFANSSSFNTYRMLITDVRNQGAANSLQFSEIQFRGQFTADTNPPTLVSFSPPAGTVQAPVSAITVRFSEPVAGVDASDLLIDGTPALAVSSSGSNFVFTFPSLPFGIRHVAFAGSHGITDFGSPPNPFDAASAAWDYTVVDTTAPVIVTYVPATNTFTRSLTRIEVIFNEQVSGVEAGDLLINNVPATDLVAGVPGQFEFIFPQPATGVVEVAWAMGHGIQDLAPVPNNFGGGAWIYTLDPNLAFADVRINEFMADNQNGIRDEDGTRQDWVELYNAGSTAVDLAGWSLTDDADNLGKWHFPVGAVMPANGYLLLWASSKNRTNNIAAYHTNFKLGKNGSFLALVLPDGTNVVSSFSPAYPAQLSDVSYGRDRLQPSIVGFYSTPTPGAPNAVGGTSGFAADVIYSLSSRTFVTPFSLTLSTASTNAVIRYVLVTNAAQATASTTNVPTTSSPIYTNPIPITATTVVRARAFEPGLFPSTPMSESYIQINNDVRNFSSDIPVCVVHMLGNGSIPPTTTTASGILMAFDNDFGRSSLTNDPQTASRMGIHARGSSTLGNPKTNMRVETWDEFNQDAKYPLLGLPSDSDWVFYGINQFDPGLMHNAIYQWLGKTLGIFNMRTRYVEMFRKIDAGPVTTNDYFGLYLLLETPKVGNDRVDIASIENQNTNAPSITGGYIMKIDRVDNEKSFTPPQIGSIRPTPSAIVFTDPPYLSTEADPRRLLQTSYMQNYILNFITNLSSVGYTNAVTGYAQYINPDQWVNHLIANIVPFNVDGYRLSGFFYKDRNGRLEQGPMWDCDRCMGTGGTTTPNGDNRCFSPRYWRLPASDVGTDNGTDFFGVSNVGVSWFQPLFRDPDFWQRFIDRYQVVRTNDYSNNSILAMLDGFYNTIKEAQVREQVRWGGTWQGSQQSFTWPRSGSQTVNGYTFDFGPADNFGRGRFTNEVNFQKRWMLDRFEFIDTNFLAMPTLSLGTTLVTTGTTVTVIPAAKAGTLLLYTLDGTDPRLPGGSVSPGIRTNIGTLTLAISNNVRLFARSYNPSHANMTNSGSEVGKPLINSFWSGPAAATYYTAVPPIRVTEIMYHPENAPVGNTNDADNFEYVEVKNIGGTPLNVNRCRLGGGIQFSFPNLVLANGQSCVVVRNLAAFQARYGTNNPSILIAGVYTGNLANDGDRVVLEGGLREPILDFNFNDAWYPITDGAGFSLVIVDENAALNTWTNKTNWRPSGAENGSPGADEAAPPAIAGIVVNEALPHTDLPQVDAIELYNPTGGDVNIGGWYLTDDFGNPKKYQVPPDTMIPAGGYIVFTETDFNPGLSGFALNSKGESVYVFSGDTNGNLTGYFHGFDFGAQQTNVSFGRYLINNGNDHFVAQVATSFGSVNGYPKVGPVVFSEVMYHPQDVIYRGQLVDNQIDEFIELHNITDHPVPLYDTNNPPSTWHLRDAVDFAFPPGVVIPPHDFVVVVSFDPANASLVTNFRNRYGVAGPLTLFGPYSGKLDNSSDSVELARPDNPQPPSAPDAGFVPYILADKVNYQSTAPWPPADGFGPALARVSVTGYGNDVTNWIAAAPSPGNASGSGTPPVITTQPATQTVVGNSTAMFSVLATGGPLAYQWTYNGGVLPGATNSVLILPLVQPAQSGQYQVIVLNPAGAVASSNAILTVLTPISIVTQPAPINTPPTSNVTVSVVTSSPRPVSYQWRFNGVNIPTATSSSLTLTNIQPANDGLYSVLCYDAISSVTSVSVRITVLVSPFIVQQPLSQAVVTNGTVVLSVSVTNTATLPVWFRWRRGGTGVTNFPLMAYTSFFTVTNVNAGVNTSTANTNWTVAVSNSANAGSAILSSAAILFPLLADRDRDGLPDLYETANGFDPDVADANLDFDTDGYTNGAEYTAGTDPRDDQSYPRITQVLNIPPLTVTFVGQTNRTYTMQYKEGLNSTQWLRLFDVVARTNSRLENVVDPSPSSNRVYRFVVPAQ